jgi:hypothetical protein
MQNTIVYLIGYAGTGKYTIAKELVLLTGAVIVDNQLINSPVFSVVACKFTHTLANRDPHMLQNGSGIICFTEGFELRGNHSHQFRRLEKGGHTSIASRFHSFSAGSTTVSFMFHLSRYQGNTLPNYPSRGNMSKKHGAAFLTFQLIIPKTPYLPFEYLSILPRSMLRSQEGCSMPSVQLRSLLSYFFSEPVTAAVTLVNGVKSGHISAQMVGNRR